MITDTYELVVNARGGAIELLPSAKAQAPRAQKDLAGSLSTLIANTEDDIVFVSSQHLDVEQIMRSISHTGIPRKLKRPKGQNRPGRGS